MKQFIVLFFVLISWSLQAQQLRYEFAAPNAVHHEAEISVTATGLKAGPVLFRMSRSSPGRYATHEFGKNVYNVMATDAAGKPLVVEKTDAEIYTVKNHAGTITLHYTLYGDYADGTYASIDATGYHLNMPASFMWVKGLENAPITLHFTVPDKEWEIATQLKPAGDAYTFTAPNLQYFMDAPTKIANLHIREWKLSNPDKKQYSFRLALEAGARETLVDSFTQKLQKIVKEAQAVYGEVPAYDYGTYTFIASLNPYVHGDGMEHRNSTMITSGRVFTGADNFLNTFAHEFFHCWNVERIRPKSLEPFDFTKSNMSEALWIAEGFTQYYGLLLMKRAGFTPDSLFNQQMASLINAKENTPGAQYYTPIENSQRAVFVDAGVSVDRTNYPNMFTSYYYYGGALALALDLKLRTQFGKTLDGFMQVLWKQFGKPEKPYTLPAVQNALAAYTSANFAKDFFQKYVYGHASIDYQPLVKAAGLQLQKAYPNQAWIGSVRYETEGSQLMIGSNTIRNTPLYEAGVDFGDVLMQLDNKPLHKAEDVAAILAQHQPGDVLQLVYQHRHNTIEKTIMLKENPAYTLVSSENATAQQKNLREDWQGTKVK